MRLTACFLLLLVLGCDDNNNNSTPSDLSFNADLAAPASATVLASTVTLTNCLAIDADNVYWTESNGTFIPDAGSQSRLMKVAKSGGTPMMLADHLDSPGCAVIDDTNAYVTQGDAILKVPLGGGSATAVFTQQHVLPASTPRIAVKNGELYWITDVYGVVDAYNGMNALVKGSTTGGPIDVVFSDVIGSPGGIAVDATNVYYSDLNGMYVRPLSGGGAVTVGSSSLHNNRFAVDDMHLAMVEVMGVGAGDVAVFKLDGSGRTVVFQKLASALAVDSSGIYANADGKLTRFSFDGMQTTVLDDQAAPRAIALDATDLYFTDGSSILRFAK